jgi:hypothetical protein
LAFGLVVDRGPPRAFFSSRNIIALRDIKELQDLDLQGEGEDTLFCLCYCFYLSVPIFALLALVVP